MVQPGTRVKLRENSAKLAAYWERGNFDVCFAPKDTEGVVGTVEPNRVSVWFQGQKAKGLLICTCDLNTFNKEFEII